MKWTFSYGQKKVKYWKNIISQIISINVESVSMNLGYKMFSGYGITSLQICKCEKKLIMIQKK